MALEKLNKEKQKLKTTVKNEEQSNGEIRFVISLLECNCSNIHVACQVNVVSCPHKATAGVSRLGGKMPYIHSKKRKRKQTFAARNTCSYCKKIDFMENRGFGVYHCMLASNPSDMDIFILKCSSLF